MLKLLDALRDQLVPFGYHREAVRYAPLLKSRMNVPLYHFLVAKHGLADKIWQSIIRTEGWGQKRLW